MIRLIIADDHKMFRDGLRSLIDRHRDIEVVGEAESGQKLLERLAPLHPDLVILDVSMPGLNGIEAARRIREIDPSVRIIMLSMHADRRYVIESLRAGASGYLLKDDGFEELVRAIPRVMSGQVVVADRIGEKLLQDYLALERPDENSAFVRLSPRERETLQLIAEGLSTKEIASTQKVSVKTVESRRKQIMDKLGLHSVAELTKFAVREGLSSLD